MNLSFKNYYKQRLMENLLKENNHLHEVNKGIFHLFGKNPIRDYFSPSQPALPTRRPRGAQPDPVGPGGTVDIDPNNPGNYEIWDNLPDSVRQRFPKIPRGFGRDSLIHPGPGGWWVRDDQGRWFWLWEVAPAGTGQGLRGPFPKGFKPGPGVLGGTIAGNGFIIVGTDSFGNPIFYNPETGEYVAPEGSPTPSDAATPASGESSSPPSNQSNSMSIGF